MPKTPPHQSLGSRTATLAATAARQHGLLTRTQARAAGFSITTINDRVRRGTWIAVDHGVYRAAETPTTWRQRLLAACLAGPAVASHRSAAALWGLPGFGEEVVEVTAIRHRRRKADDVIWHESRRLDEREICELNGIEVTHVTRTLLDLGAVVGVDALLAAFDDGARRSLTSWSTLAREFEEFGASRIGATVVRAALDLRSPAEPVPASTLETTFDALAREHELPTPARQWPIHDADGNIIARVDFAFVSARLAIEIDGARYHAGEGNWRADLARQNRITAAGWRILRFTARDLRDQGAGVAVAIRTALLWTCVSSAGITV